MDSIKSIVVVAILLGVLYGIYQVINDDDSPVSPSSTNLMAEFDKDQANNKDADEKDTEGDEDQSSASGDLKSGESNSGSFENRMQVNVKPPPSTFDPEAAKFVYPEPKQPSPTAPTEGDGFESLDKTDSRPPGQFDLVERNEKQGNTRTSAPAFKETGQGLSESAAVKEGSGIYQPELESSGQGQAIPAGAEASINDPRNRFVRGSLADFANQVVGDMDKAEALIRNKDFVGALRLLTKFYDDSRLTREENQNLSSWLDPLAGKVIYSEEPHLAEPYFVRPNDTLNLLSVKFHVPPELIFNINRRNIPDPTKLVPGTELKMVKGPFNVEISLTKKKMTLFVKGLYAGTFKIRIGDEPYPKLGKFRVLSKSRLGQDYSDQNYQRIDAATPNNPYGQHYLNIGGGMAIHGSAQVSDSNDRRGCISLNAIDAEDVHNILTTESTVVIVK